MRRLSAELVAGMATLVVCVAIVVPVPFVTPADQFLVPVWVWGALAVLFFGATFACVAVSERSARAVVASLVQTVLVAALLITVPGAGWLPILLVFGAALSTYVAPRWTTVVVVAANTVTLTVTVALAGAFGPGVLSGAVGIAMYVLLQVSSVLVCIALQREQEMRAALSAAHTELAAAAVLREEASRASERLRISRELHDLIGHQLTVLTLELESAVHRDPVDAREHVERARTVARELLGDVRATVGELRRRAPDLRAALESVAAAVPQPRVVVTVADDVVADEEQTAALVRVAQELVTNAVRHAELATVLRLEVAASGDRLTLVAQDDGLTAGDVRLGNGLRGMVERLEALGGGARFDASSGFRVEAHLAARAAS